MKINSLNIVLPYSYIPSIVNNRLMMLSVKDRPKAGILLSHVYFSTDVAHVRRKHASAVQPPSQLKYFNINRDAGTVSWTNRFLFIQLLFTSYAITGMPAVPSTLGKLARRALITAGPALTQPHLHHFERRGLSVNHTQGVTLGVLVAYIIIIAILWNVPYIRWVLWPFKVCSQLLTASSTCM